MSKGSDIILWEFGRWQFVTKNLFQRYRMTPWFGFRRYTHKAKREAVNITGSTTREMGGETHGLTAIIVSEENALLWVPIRIKVSKLNQSPKFDYSSRKYGISTYINARTTIPEITSRMGTRIKFWMKSNDAWGSRLEGISLVNHERVAVRCDSQNNFPQWNSSRMPFLHGGNGRTSLILGGGTCIIEWRIGSNCGAPSPLVTIIHDLDAI